MSRSRVSSDTDELIFPLQERGDAHFEVQIDEVHRMGEFIHQPPKQTIEVPGRTAAHSYVEVGARPEAAGGHRAKDEHIPASLLLADLDRAGYIGAVLLGNRLPWHCHPRFPGIRRRSKLE